MKLRYLVPLIAVIVGVLCIMIYRINDPLSSFASVVVTMLLLPSLLTCFSPLFCIDFFVLDVVVCLATYYLIGLLLEKLLQKKMHKAQSRKRKKSQ